MAPTPTLTKLLVWNEVTIGQIISYAAEHPIRFQSAIHKKAEQELIQAVVAEIVNWDNQDG